MNRKNILALALGAVLSLGMVQMTAEPLTAEASFEPPYSAAKQERMAQGQLKKDAYPMNELTGRQRDLYNKLFAIQKRLALANNMEIVDTPFTDRHEHERKIHPLRLGKDKGWSYSVGAGYIVISDTNWQFNDLKAKAKITRTIAHEMGHSVRNGSFVRMGLFTALRGKHESRLEETAADRKSVEFVDPLPEGGWGYYLLGNNRFNYQTQKHSKHRVYYHAWKAVCEDIEKATQNHIQISVKGTYGINYVDGKKNYPIYAPRGYSDYLGGQIAECVAKGVFLPRNLRVVPASELDPQSHYPAKNIIICSSPKLPNGYRALGFADDKDITALKKLLAKYTHSPVDNHDSYVKNAEKLQHAQSPAAYYFDIDAYQLQEIVTLAHLEEARQHR